MSRIHASCISCSLVFLCICPSQSQKGTPLLTLMKDPYIIIAAGKKISTLCYSSSEKHQWDVVFYNGAIYIYVCIYVYMCVCIYVCMYICVYAKCAYNAGYVHFYQRGNMLRKDRHTEALAEMRPTLPKPQQK